MAERTEAQKKVLEEAQKKAAEANKGNKNSSKQNRIWGNIIRKLAVQEDYKRLHEIAHALYAKAAEGDMSAIKELGDRIDGKSVSTTELSGIDGSDLPLGITVKYVKPDSTD
jgi:hypothetical protein